MVSLMRKLLLGLLLAVCADAIAADPFDKAAARHGVSADLLRAIAKVESAHNPWALNINGADCQDKGNPHFIRGQWLFCDSRSNSIAILLHASKNPWLLSAKGPNGATLYIWAKHEDHAKSLAARNHLDVIKIKRKNVLSTDIGIMQVNWRAHGGNILDTSLLFNQEYNVDYGAKFLADLISRHGKEVAVGMYHTGENGSKNRQLRYRQAVSRHYAALQ